MFPIYPHLTQSHIQRVATSQSYDPLLPVFGYQLDSSQLLNIGLYPVSRLQLCVSTRNACSHIHLSLSLYISFPSHSLPSSPLSCLLSLPSTLPQARNSYSNEVVAIKKMSYNGKQTTEVRGLQPFTHFKHKIN